MDSPGRCSALNASGGRTIVPLNAAVRVAFPIVAGCLALCLGCAGIKHTAAYRCDLRQTLQTSLRRDLNDNGPVTPDVKDGADARLGVVLTDVDHNEKPIWIMTWFFAPLQLFGVPMNRSVVKLALRVEPTNAQARLLYQATERVRGQISLERATIRDQRLVGKAVAAAKTLTGRPSPRTAPPPPRPSAPTAANWMGFGAWSLSSLSEFPLQAGDLGGPPSRQRSSVRPGGRGSPPLFAVAGVAVDCSAGAIE